METDRPFRGLPRIRVTETHGIRRFLYPLTTLLEMPRGIDPQALALRKADGTRIPLQIAPASDYARVDFALSLAPLEIVDLEFVAGTPDPIPDPLHVAAADGLVNRQERIRMEFGSDSLLRSLVYDGTQHLRAPLRIERDGEVMVLDGNAPAVTPPPSPLSARVRSAGTYPDSAEAWTYSEITACKSWVTVRHDLSEDAGKYDVLMTLPFAATGPDLLCDFGLGGGIYTRLSRQSGATVRLDIDGELNWSLTNGGREDYRGTVATWSELRPQLWFHVVDDAKAVAIALSHMPEIAGAISIGITASGDIIVRFTAYPVSYGLIGYEVCYHFLNAVPAIAAATCPQSILLPPVVETLNP